MTVQHHLNGERSKRRLLIIGVDAGSPELFRKWSAAGDLPNLSRLVKDGQTRAVKNPSGLEAGSVWPTFHSGLLPGSQPQYDGRRWFSPDDYSVRWYEPADTPPTFWRQLSDQGLNCLLIDPPYTHLDPAVNGSMIVDWGSHVPANGRQFEFCAHPPDLADEVLDLVGADPAGGIMCDRRSPQTLADHRHFRDIHLKRIEAKGRLSEHLLRTKSWDLGLLVSTDLHCSGHHLWHVNDPDHPRYSRKLEDALGEPLRDCYRAFDRSLGAMLEAVGPETTVLFFGSHGMGPSYSGTGLLDRILMGLDERLTGTSASDTTVENSRGTISLRRTLRRAWRGLPAEVRGRLRPIRRPFKGAFRPPQFMPGKEQRSFFEVHANNATGGIRLNLRGREGQGTIEPQRAQEVISYLIAELRKFENADTGEPLIEDAFATSEKFDGPYASNLPDILVQWNRKAPIFRVVSPSAGVLTHEYSDNRSGDHTPDGFCVTRGQHIPQGHHSDNVSSVDFAPAVAAFFDMQIQHSDGHKFSLGRRTETA